MITVQAVHFTARTQEWHRFVQALGLTPRPPLDAEWSEFDADGVLAIHLADTGGPAAGTTTLQLLVDDLDDIESRWRAANVAVERSSLAGVGEVVIARSIGGVGITAIAATAPPHRSDGLSVMPVWYAPDLAEPERILTAAGLGVRIRSDSGTWTDLTADAGGMVGLHSGPPAVELSFEYAGDLDVLARTLADAGYRAEVIDEAYNRTLLVDTPDGGALRINGAQDDLHGYTRIG